MYINLEVQKGKERSNFLARLFCAGRANVISKSHYKFLPVLVQ